MRIVIGGDTGSGKTTILNLFRENMWLNIYSVGEKRRELISKYLSAGMSINDLNKRDELSPYESTTDKIVDDWQRELGRKEDNFAIEGRLCYYFISNADIKIYLAIDPRTAAERILGKKRLGDGSFHTLDEVIEFNRKKLESDSRRYKKFYGIEYPDMSVYDAVIDTTLKTPQEVFELISKEMANKGLFHNS